jgi:hypothetical protein
MAKTWELPAYTVSVKEEADREEGDPPSNHITLVLHKDSLAPYEAANLADALIRAMHEVTYHRHMRRHGGENAV